MVPVIWRWGTLVCPFVSFSLAFLSRSSLETWPNSEAIFLNGEFHEGPCHAFPLCYEPSEWQLFGYSEVIHSRYVAETAVSVVSEHGIDSSSVGVMKGFSIGLVCSCLVTWILPIWRSEFAVVALFHRQDWRFLLHSSWTFNMIWVVHITCIGMKKD